MQDIKQKFDEVLHNINIAKQESKYGQNVKLVVVSKMVDIDKVRMVNSFGAVDFGENRPQELLRKYETFSNLNWHQIGTLQKNKVKYIIDKVKLIHSLDSIELANKIDEKAKQLGIVVNCLLQINISKEPTKHGISDKDVFEFIKIVSQCNKNIVIKGLMAMAPYEHNIEKTRPYFQKMKEMMLEINLKNINSVNISELSMGMSNDYKIAIQEGSTIVRIGTSIFG